MDSDKRGCLRLARWLAVMMLVLLSACAGQKSPPAGGPEIFQAEFLGQDGGDYAGELCSAGSKSDNVHIHLSGMPAEGQPLTFRVEDFTHGGLWATPCDPVSNWFLYARPVKAGETDLYFKPFRDAPAGTGYKVSVTYANGTTLVAEVEGTRVKP